jgi:hypothetical protein
MEFRISTNTSDHSSNYSSTDRSETNYTRRSQMLITTPTKHGPPTLTICLLPVEDQAFRGDVLQSPRCMWAASFYLLALQKCMAHDMWINAVIFKLFI